MFWPPTYAATYTPRRTIGLLQDGRMKTEKGDDLRCGDWETLRDLVAQRDITLYTDEYPDWLILGALEANRPARVIYSENKGILSVSYREGKKTGWVIPCSAWELEGEGIFGIRSLLDYCGCGDQRTPGALGQALMSRYLKRTPEDTIFLRPPLHCRRRIWESSPGGRVDTIQPGKKFPVLVEEDVNDAYLARCLWLPGGTPALTDRETGAAGYYKCSVTISRKLPLGPFPVRRRQVPRGSFLVRGVHDTQYPTRPGTYETWLWSGEIADARAAACRVEVSRGYTWPRMVDALLDWALLMNALRQGSGALAPQVKKSVVCALARFGSRQETLYLTLQDSATAVPLLEWDREGKSHVSGIYIDSEITDSPYQLPHWYSFIIAEQRRALYQRALPRQTARELVATNYDAVYHSGAPSVSETGLGGWKTRLLHDATIIAARQLISIEKTTLPGVPRGNWIIC